MVSEDTMEKWRNSAFSADILKVPGIDAEAAEKLAASADQITNQYMLFGWYLMIKGPENEVGIIEHHERFWCYLEYLGITAHRSAIVTVRSIRLVPSCHSGIAFLCRPVYSHVSAILLLGNTQAIAEKCESFFPGLYDANVYLSDNEEDE
jgi:hypothetical protein